MVKKRKTLRQYLFTEGVKDFIFQHSENKALYQVRCPPYGETTLKGKNTWIQIKYLDNKQGFALENLANRLTDFRVNSRPPI